MANRMKEDEKNEKIIRGLLKLPENRRCINCSSLGPQYVCTNFWTFICTTCSGIHREFTHRVKSVSMAKFTSQEVIALQGGGNECAKEIYLKEWDSQRYSAPDSSNVERLRDFIRHVYVDRRYVGERSIDKPSRVKMGDKEDSYKYRSGSGSPPYADTYEHRYGERSGPGGRSDERSPGYDQDSQKNGSARSEVVADRHQDNRSGNVRSEDNRFPDGESKLEGRPQNHQKELGSFSPPLVRPIRDILGDNIQPLRIGEPPKANGARASNGSTQTQRTISSSSLGSVNENPVELKMANSGSLIDFDADPGPPVVAAAPQTLQASLSSGQSITQATVPSSDGGNWASFDFQSQENVSQAPSSANIVDSLMSQLSVPAAAPAGNMSMLPDNSGVFAAGVNITPATSQVNSMPILPSVGRSPAPADVGHWPNVRHPQHSLFQTADSLSTIQQITQHVGAAFNNQGSLSTPTLQSFKPLSELNNDFSSGAMSNPSTFEPKSSGRKELSEDLFTYSPAPAPVPGYQAVPPHGMGFGVHYPTARLQHRQSFPQLSKTTNPFDLNHESALVQAPMFPSMASLQGALPNVSTPTGLLRTYSLGTPAVQWGPPHAPSYTSAMPPQPPSYASAMHPHPSSYSSGMPPSAYMGQQIPSNLPSLGYQRVGGFGNEGIAFGTLNSNQQLGGRFSAPATPSSSVGGNPFG
uniref:Putative ADP-ribosylation factor GTPase-activating protein AGD14 isoform X2 n=1 Tax=Davidia involucrata TaxID=16924 RepID=A0A5B7AJG8_DAVIN